MSSRFVCRFGCTYRCEQSFFQLNWFKAKPFTPYYLQPDIEKRGFIVKHKNRIRIFRIYHRIKKSSCLRSFMLAYMYIVSATFKGLYLWPLMLSYKMKVAQAKKGREPLM